MAAAVALAASKRGDGAADEVVVIKELFWPKLLVLLVLFLFWLLIRLAPIWCELNDWPARVPEVIAAATLVGCRLAAPPMEHAGLDAAMGLFARMLLIFWCVWFARVLCGGGGCSCWFCGTGAASEVFALPMLVVWWISERGDDN